MLSVAEAHARLLVPAPRPLSLERIGLAEADGRVLATDMLTPGALPPFDASAMDGYAVATADFDGEGPWSWPVTATSPAGTHVQPLLSRSVGRVFTGAEVPAGADAVVMQEHVTVEAGTAHFSLRPRPGQNIRRAGEDLARGSLALRAGTRLSPGAIALAAMLGRPEVVVVRRPRVTVLCTGDELRSPGEEMRPGSIPESNSAPLAALVRRGGGTVRVAPIVRDDAAATERAIEHALEGTDLLVTVGGVSVGDYDFVRPALARAGVALDFWKVAIKPGKPLAVGSTGSCRVLGLPGNPASALVTFGLFGMPLLRALQGDARPLPMPLRVRLACERRRLPERTEYVRASLALENGETVAQPHGNQASGAATSLAASDGLLVIPAGEGHLATGTPVDFIRWNDL